MTTSPEMLTYKAKLAEQLELYGEMKDAMKELVKSKKILSEEERNLLSVAYKNVVGQRRTSWRIVWSLENKPDMAPEKKQICDEYRQKIETELVTFCDEIIGLLRDHLLQPDVEENEDAETAVFFNKMHGDYLRYKVEISKAEERAALSDESMAAYGRAHEIATKELHPTHPIRLGLALNFSVYYFEIANDSTKACELAKSAFDKAMETLDKSNGDTYKDSTLIMQLLRDNLSLWAEDEEPENQPQD